MTFVKGYSPTQETRNKMRMAKLGKPSLKKGKNYGYSAWNKGMKGYTNGGTFKKGHKGIRGSDNNKWKGGITKQKWYKKFYDYLTYAKRKNAIGFFTIDEWNFLKEQYHFRCASCNKIEPEIKLTVDHIIPLKENGTNFIENIQPLCRSCNCKKHAKMDRVDEFMALKQETELLWNFELKIYYGI